MKALSVFGLILFSSVLANAASTSELLVQAKEAYSKRAYTAEGAQAAKQAADLFHQAASSTNDSAQKAAALTGKGEALFFVGEVSEAKNTKIDMHLKGMEAADQATKALGLQDVTKATDADVARLKSALNSDQLALLGEALYVRGINLGQWGSANGVTSSLSRWPELRDSMQLMVKLGLKEARYYGAYRILGRGFYKIPALLGGSVKKAEQYLSAAVKGTLASGQTYSVQGHNNLYYAEVLKENGKKQEARALLEGFVKANPSNLIPGYEEETRRVQKEAEAFLKTL